MAENQKTSKEFVKKKGTAKKRKQDIEQNIFEIKKIQKKRCRWKGKKKNNELLVENKLKCRKYKVYWMLEWKFLKA